MMATIMADISCHILTKPGRNFSACRTYLLVHASYVSKGIQCVSPADLRQILVAWTIKSLRYEFALKKQHTNGGTAISQA
jgi:hypothetical protein